MTVTGDGLAYQVLDGGQAAAFTEDFHELHAEVYADPPYRQAGDEDYPRRFAVQRRQPGFVLAEARNGGYLVGFAAGMPLRPSTSWWRELTIPLPDEVTAEHAGRTFALAFTFSGDKISQIDVVADPDRLAALDLAILE